MSFIVRDGIIDVAVIAGPMLSHWPTVGARTISMVCAEMGLVPALIGGETLRPRGVIPLPGTGALAWAEDVQGRIHRFHARSVVRVSPINRLPDSFSNWWSEGLIPLSTASVLKARALVSWGPTTVILGTGNQALRFGSLLLESGVHEVLCIEPFVLWGGKRYAGWEVERRRFEMLRGKIIEGKPLSITKKAALLWELRIEDEQGIRVIETSRVVSAGPYWDSPGVREYPPGSNLFELESTALSEAEQDFEGWSQEEERGRLLGTKIVKALQTDLGNKRDELDRLQRKARLRLKRYKVHRERPFAPVYEGKWVAPADAKKIRAYPGVPDGAQFTRIIASIECFEKISCKICQKACPEGAIDFTHRVKERILTEADCTACGICVEVCPSGSPLLMNEKADRSVSDLTISWRGARPWKKGELASLLNRQGDSLGSARVMAILPTVSAEPQLQLVQLSVPTHLVWEARSIRREKEPATEDQAFLASVSSEALPRVEIHLNGEKRLVREGITVGLALFETGHARPRDILLCPTGECGLCNILVDGVKRPACQTNVRKGMAIRIAEPVPRDIAQRPNYESALCPCLAVSREQVSSKIRQGLLRSPEAVLSVTHVGEGKCHGMLCADPLRRLMLEEGIDCKDWIHWSFPWTDWSLSPQSSDRRE